MRQLKASHDAKLAAEAIALEQTTKVCDLEAVMSKLRKAAGIDMDLITFLRQEVLNKSHVIDQLSKTLQSTKKAAEHGTSEQQDLLINTLKQRVEQLTHKNTEAGKFATARQELMEPSQAGAPAEAESSDLQNWEDLVHQQSGETPSLPVSTSASSTNGAHRSTQGKLASSYMLLSSQGPSIHPATIGMNCMAVCYSDLQPLCHTTSQDSVVHQQTLFARDWQQPGSQFH